MDAEAVERLSTLRDTLERIIKDELEDGTEDVGGKKRIRLKQALDARQITNLHANLVAAAIELTSVLADLA